MLKQITRDPYRKTPYPDATYPTCRVVYEGGEEDEDITQMIDWNLVVAYDAVPPLPEASCCNHNCRQGRDCPNRKPRRLPRPLLLLGVLWAVLLTWYLL